LASVLVSQPFDTLASQSANPVEQESVQLPSAQLGVAFTLLQGALHAPQFALSVLVLVSQPFESRPSQLPKPMLHEATPHAPFVQAADALAGAHGFEQPPQCATLVAVSTSQPSES